MLACPSLSFCLLRLIVLGIFVRKFRYDGTGMQQADAICYAFSPDLLDASEEELREFLAVLSQHFPRTDNGQGGFTPMTDNEPLLACFNTAHRHVCELIAVRRETFRHRWILGVSIGTLFVLVATLAHQVSSKSSDVPCGSENSSAVAQADCPVTPHAPHPPSPPTAPAHTPAPSAPRAAR